MNLKSFKRIVIKVGTNVLTNAQGGVSPSKIVDLAGQIAQLIKQERKEIILVSSGAVGAARNKVDLGKSMSKVVQRQVWSSVGQIELMNHYRLAFEEQQLFAAQVLATKEDFRDRQHYVNMKNCFLALLRRDIVPIVNENDVTSIAELMFTDNDELSSLVAGLVNADALIILSSVNGLLHHQTKETIPQVSAYDRKVHEHISSKKSSFGRGGMLTKVHMAQRSARLGIATYICNGHHDRVLLNLMERTKDATFFPPEQKKSNIKRWLATVSSEECNVYITSGAKEILEQGNPASLLPIGIERLHGSFSKGDLVHIIYNEKVIGIGLANYSSNRLQENLSQKNKPYFIHYDYLLIY